MLIQIEIFLCDSIRFDSRSQFSWTDGSWGKNVIIFAVDYSSSEHIDNKNKNILNW